MSQPDPFTVTIDSEEFRCICVELDRLEFDVNAQPAHDGMSGGFKFPDEVPHNLRSKHQLALCMVTVLRSLWGYRHSCVQGQPRTDLAPWWEAVKELAPRWPGFSDERCSNAMRSISEICNSKSSGLSDDLDSLDTR